MLAVELKRRMKLLVVLYMCSYIHCQGTGTPEGFLTECPGWNSTTTISADTLRSISVSVYRETGTKVYRKMYRFPNAARSVSRDPNVDFGVRKTLVYFDGYLGSTKHIFNKAMAEAYARKNYNVLQLETFSIFLQVYPTAARLTKPIGLLMGEFLANLTKSGLKPADLELVGFSLGGHSGAIAADRFHQLTGSKPARLTGLDPAGPCFRNSHPELSINPRLADHVDVLHTNIDGFGTAEALGHVDFYANGGEFQPSRLFLPCLVVCSHYKAVFYWWTSILNPDEFIASRCASVQDARRGNCYDDDQPTNLLGLKTNFSKGGIYYLPTRNNFPYFTGKEGIEKRHRPTSYVADFVSSGDIVV